MNRKIAVAAIVGGLVHAVGLLRGQEPEPRVPRVPAGEPTLPRIEGAVSPTQEAALTRKVAEDLQRQINELARRLAAVEETQATTVGFSKSGNDLVLAPAGKVSIKAGTGLALQGVTIDVTASANLVQRGALILLN
jgi:hypothetical protein